MAGCRPEYLPVVIAALEAVCTDEFNIHGVMATTGADSSDRRERPDSPFGSRWKHGYDALGYGTHPTRHRARGELVMPMSAARGRAR